MRAEAPWRLAIVAYVLVQMAVRVVTGPTLELDEAEAFVFGQDLRPGYGPQPPLYFWLQWLVFRITGETVLGVAALKAAILGGTLMLLLDLLRRELPLAAAGAATLSTGFLLQVSWESQRALTHSSLALLAAVAMAAWTIRALRSGSWRDHLVLGLWAGVGLMAKLNVALWAAGLVLAALLRPAWRRQVRPARLIAAGGAALALNAPAFAWMLANPDLALRSAGKFEASSGGFAALQGLGALALAALSFNGPGLLAVGIAWALGRQRGASPSAPPALAFLAVATVASLALVAAGIVASGSTEVRDRWLLPLAWPIVPVLVAWAWPALTARARRGLAGAAAAFWIVAAAALPYASLVNPGYRGADFSALEAALRAAGADERPVLLTDTWPTGNLQLRGVIADATYLPRLENLPAGPSILVSPASGSVASDPAITARIEARQEVDVPHGARSQALLVLRLRGA